MRYLLNTSCFYLHSGIQGEITLSRDRNTIFRLENLNLRYNIEKDQYIGALLTKETGVRISIKERRFASFQNEDDLILVSVLP